MSERVRTLVTKWCDEARAIRAGATGEPWPDAVREAKASAREQCARELDEAAGANGCTCPDKPARSGVKDATR